MAADIMLESSSPDSWFTFRKQHGVDRKLIYELTLLPSGFRGRYAGEGTANIKPLEISWSRVSRCLAYSF